ncbi:hypothetical protein KEM52_002224 [Ascosphaera acerosa]|nr:hypothetical protein KEM52_002224 [Ascosphaera acerosa]
MASKPPYKRASAPSPTSGLSYKSAIAAAAAAAAATAPTSASAAPTTEQAPGQASGAGESVGTKEGKKKKKRRKKKGKGEQQDKGNDEKSSELGGQEYAARDDAQAHVPQPQPQPQSTGAGAGAGAGGDDASQARVTASAAGVSGPAAGCRWRTYARSRMKTRSQSDRKLHPGLKCSRDLEAVVEHLSSNTLPPKRKREELDKAATTAAGSQNQCQSASDAVVVDVAGAVAVLVDRSGTTAPTRPSKRSKVKSEGHKQQQQQHQQQQQRRQAPTTAASRTQSSPNTVVALWQL